MAIRRLGRYTVAFDGRPAIETTGVIAGKNESQGPLGAEFDIRSEDDFFGQKTWEQAEAEMQKTALARALEKQGLEKDSLDIIFAGDLENQCIASSYGLRDFATPLAGLYGACSTMAEGLALAAVFAESGAAARAAAVTSSHFATAEKQFRYPLEYGGQRPPTSQWTVTAAGAGVVCPREICTKKNAPYISAAAFGMITELGVKDINNMGAAMAPAAASTIRQFLADTGTAPKDYDMILTGDLGELGVRLLREILLGEGIAADSKTEDCGMLVYDNSDRSYGCGGSGCGCSAAVLNSHIYNRLCGGDLKRVLFVGTGALMSPISVFQGEVIPAVAHAVLICGV